MAEVIEMPRLSDTMTEGVIAAWHKKVGDNVTAGDLLAEIETDKATMDFESPEDGVLLHIGIGEGKGIPVGSLLAVVGSKGEDVKEIIESYANKATGESESAPAEKESANTPPPPPVVVDAPVAEPVTTAPPVSQGEVSADGKHKASPLARVMAKEKGIDLDLVNGSGDNGRIVKRDIENFKAPATTGSMPAIPQVAGQESFEEVGISQMRKTIARRLSESKFSAPHFYLTMEINMDAAVAARKSINEVAPVKISFNDIIIRACAAALRKHPKVNSSWLGDRIRYNHHVHIGMAVAVDEGLLVPVIRFADQKGLAAISQEAKTLAEKARNKKLQPSEWEGTTFTVSNLGMFGIEEFTAIINPPDACILAIGGIKQQPIVKDGQIVVGNTMKVTLSCDHRVVDGALGSAFLVTLKELLENPVRILI